jgi:hypothetical protein
MSPRSQDGRSYSSNNSSQDNRSFNTSVQDGLSFSSQQAIQESLTFSDTDSLNFIPHSSSVQDTLKFSTPVVIEDTLCNFNASAAEVSAAMDIKASEQSNVCKVRYGREHILLAFYILHL